MGELRSTMLETCRRSAWETSTSLGANSDGLRRRIFHQGLPPPSMPPPPVMVKLATWETPIKAEALRGHDVGSADVVTLPSMSSVVLDQASPEKAMGQML